MKLSLRYRLLSQKAVKAGHMPLSRRLRRLSNRELREEAAAFIALYCREEKHGDRTDAARKRLASVNRQIKKSGTYTHSFEEIEFGARVAWRNHARCIGRLYWRSLKVFDKRDVSDPDAMFETLTDQMRHALGHGKIQSTISIFPPLGSEGLPAHVESDQATRYAGYAIKRGQVMGDRKHIEATRIATADGWTGSGGHFDVLPVSLISSKGQRIHRTLPSDAYKIIQLRHEGYPQFNELELQWYAVPMISNMILSIGGIDYPCAPFNGFYVATEIANRNFIDPWRFNMLPQIAESFGFDPDGDDKFWRDRAVTELNAAVVSSYSAAGITMLDHHSASDQFMEFKSRENVAGRKVHADWTWIVPPQSSAVTQPFHLDLDDACAVPNFYHSWSDDGRKLMPYYGDEHRSRNEERLDRIKRRYTNWVRHPNH